MQEKQLYTKVFEFKLKQGEFTYNSMLTRAGMYHFYLADGVYHLLIKLRPHSKASYCLSFLKIISG